jgi:hypothetical protein
MYGFLAIYQYCLNYFNLETEFQKFWNTVLLFAKLTGASPAGRL